MILGMEPLHISEGELAKDVQSVLRRVETGAEVIIERDTYAVAVIRPLEPMRRKISECIALLPADSTATIDPDFAKDVEAAISAHREPLEPPAWDDARLDGDRRRRTPGQERPPTARIRGAGNW
jgi:antitoxin (DNA-binding transcriptional repressor) of toxin-antitoxin stability system